MDFTKRLNESIVSNQRNEEKINTLSELTLQDRAKPEDLQFRFDLYRTNFECGHDLGNVNIGPTLGRAAKNIGPTRGFVFFTLTNDNISFKLASSNIYPNMTLFHIHFRQQLLACLF